MDETNRIADVVLTIQESIRSNTNKIEDLSKKLDTAEAGYNKYISIFNQIKEAKREKSELIKTLNSMIKLYELTTGKKFEEPNLFNTAEPDNMEVLNAAKNN